MVERSYDDFDAYASSYRSIHNENIKLSGADSFYFAEMKVKLLRPHETDAELKILDLGCGDGTTAFFMRKYFSLWNITGVDVSAKSIEEAQRKQISNTTFLVYDGNLLPFEPASFDIIFIAGVLHHIAFSLHQHIVKTAAALLKPGGRLYLFEHNPLNPLTKYLVNTCVFDKEAKLLHSSYAKQLIRQNELSVQQLNYIIFFPRKGILAKFIFMEKWLQWLPLGGQYFIKAQKS